MVLTGHPDPNNLGTPPEPCTPSPPGTRCGAWRFVGRSAAVAFVSLTAAACSLSFPIASLTDDTPTGSVARSQASLSPALDNEDWRRAKAALAVALDPQGNGADVAWNNPASGSKGSFVALAPPYLAENRVCRAFHARVSPATKPEHRLAGSACRTGNGEWTLRDLKDQGNA